MPKQERSVDRVIVRAAKDAAQEAVDQRVEEIQEGLLGERFPGLVGEGLEETEEQRKVNALFDVGSLEGHYLKLYKENEGAMPEYKMKIENFKDWTDLEHEIGSIIRGKTKQFPNRWGPGIYKVILWEDGVPHGKREEKRFTIDAEEPEDGRGIPVPEDTTKKIAELASLILAVKEIVGVKEDPVKIADMLAKSFEKGLGVNPKPEIVDRTTELMSIMTKLKEFKVFEPPPQPPANNLLDMIKALKELGLIGQPVSSNSTATLKETIDLLKEAGIIAPKKEEKENDPLAMVEKVAGLINAVRGIAGGDLGPGEKPSLGIELVRILGPRVPEMVGRITDTVNNVAEVSRLKLEKRMGVDSGGRALAPPVTRAVKTEEELPLGAVNPPSMVSEGPQVNPVVKEIYDSIESRDKAYYPRLKQLIEIYIGPHLLPSILSGQLSQEDFLTQLAVSLQNPYFAEEKARIYFSEFLSSLVPLVAAETMVVGRCNRCGDTYEFDGEEQFKADTKQCDASGSEGPCGGTIEKVIPAEAG